MKFSALASTFCLLLVAAGCGNTGGTSGQCIAAGGICTLSVTCCSRNCDTKTGKCVGGDVNNGNPDMAMSQQQHPDMTMMQGCQPLASPCAVPGDCCQGLTCTANKCVPPVSLKQFGEPCVANKDCATALCVGVDGINGRFCSAACTKSTDCTALSNNPPYWCAKGNGSNFCLRDCMSSADCQDIGADWSCDVLASVDSLYKGMCGIYQNLAPGQPCLEDKQCAGSQCGSAWCADACGSDAQCGTLARCVNTMNGYLCFPTCTTDNDCLKFGRGNLITCQQTTTINGATQKVCSF